MNKEEICDIVNSIMGSTSLAEEVTRYVTADGTMYTEENCADLHNNVMALFAQYNLQNDTQQRIRAAVFRELLVRYCIIQE